MGMIIRPSGHMELFVVNEGGDPIETIQDVVGGDDLPLALPSGGDMVFNRDAKEDGLPLNATASRMAIAALGPEHPPIALYGTCILFRPGELDKFEEESDLGG